MSWIARVARFKARQSRGGAWIQMILNIGIITANIALFKNWFESFGVSLGTMLVIGVVAYLLGTVLIGFFDEHYGIWQHENDFNTNLNPFMINLDKKIEEILKK
jgi:predicted membrane channel-forming protein YqfA (hemolysin III family)